MSTSYITLAPGCFFDSTRISLETESFLCAESRATFSGQRVPPHRHSSSHFLYVIRGAYVTRTRGQDVICGPGTLLFIPTGTTHSDHFQNAGGRFVTITPRPDVACQLDAVFPTPLLLENAEARDCVSRMRKLLPSIDGMGPMMVETASLELVASLTPSFKDDGEHLPSWLLRAKELISDCCTTGVSIHSIAQAVAVHPVHLARTFRSHFFMSPAEYLRRCRINKARQLLLGSSRPLAEVAGDVGFSDQSHFANAFKRETGMTPAYYRGLRARIAMFHPRKTIGVRQDYDQKRKR